MTLAEVQALEHITVVEVLNHPRVGEYYKVVSDKENGWYIHSTTWESPEDEEYGIPKTYQWCAFLYATNDISTVQVVHISEIPEDAEICALGGDLEVMSNKTDEQTE